MTDQPPMKLSMLEKSQRALRFLLSLRNPRIATALARYGFSQQDYDEGWRILAALGVGKLPALEGLHDRVKLIAKLHEWERRWWPVVRATLEHRFPHVAELVSIKACDRRAPHASSLLVEEIVSRLDAWFKNVHLYGPDSEGAQRLLEARGLTEKVLENAQELLVALNEPCAEPDWLKAQADSQTQAEAALWRWYLEWSRIARIAVKERSLLRQLGFKPGGEGGCSEPET